MARIIQDDQGGSDSAGSQLTVIQLDGENTLALPDGDFMGKGDILRDGQDLVLQSSDGHQVIVEGYFSALPAPTLTTTSGSSLTPELVQSFAHAQTPQYAANETAGDASAIGIIKEFSGDATITRADGSSEKIAPGMEVHQGDIVETAANGAVNIVFLDESSFAISHNARMAIDEYVYDPATQGGQTDISILRGMFVFTSGLIGRDDPDDVHIETPVGSIGIRGTTIAGNIQPDGQSQITVVEGAIVIKNGSGEVTLADQYQTVNLSGFDAPIQMVGTLEASQMKAAYGVIGTVAPAFMNTLNVAPEAEGHEQPADAAPDNVEDAPTGTPTDNPADNTAAPDATQGQADAAQPVIASYDIFSDPLNTGFDESIKAEASTPFDTTTVTGASLAGAAGLSFMTAPAVPLASNGTVAEPATSVGNNVQEAPLPPLEVVVEIRVDDNAVTGDIVGKVFTTIAYPNVDIKFANVPMDGGMPVFELVQVAPGVYNVVLTAAGSNALGLIAGGTSTSLGDVEVTATLPDGRNAVSAAPTQYGDYDGSHVPVTPGSVADLSLNTLTAPDGMTNILPAGSTDGMGYHAAYLGDYNRDGSADFAYSYDTTGTLNIGGTNYTVNTGQNLIAGNGDMNGDGYLDVISGSAYYNVNQGQVHVHNGANPAIYSTTIGSVGDVLGSSVAMVDFNGDGYADVFTGAKGAYGNEGRVSFYAGNSAMSFTGFTYTVFADGVAGGYSDMTGIAMTGLRDYNNDGFGDIAVARMTSATAGEVIIYAGSDSNTPVPNAIAHIAVGAVDNFNIPIIDLGDINGDGKSDILIGETGFNANNDALIEGRVLLALGGGSGLSATVDVAAGSSFVGIGSAGDFNGDGYNDIFMATRTGNMVDAYVIYGDPAIPGTLTLDATWLANNQDAYYHMTLDLTAYGAPTGFEMSSIGAGDQNGDGYEDLLMTMPDLNGGAGGYFLVYGRADAQAGATPGLVGTSGNDTLNNLSGHTGFSAGNGNDTITLSGIGNALAHAIDGGNGEDTLTFTTPGNLDLRNIGQLENIEKISLGGNSPQILSIGLNDVFSLLQTSDQKMNAGSGNLYTLIFNDDDNASADQLIIDTSGSASDMATAGFSAQGTYTDGGGNVYDIYTFGSGYQLLIDTDITVTVQ